MDTLKEKAKWKIAPIEELEEPKQSTKNCQAIVEDEEESEDCDCWHYWETDMLAEDGLPKIGYLKLPQVLTLIPVSSSTWWAGIQTGRYPKGIKLSEKSTAWDVNEIRVLVAKLKTEYTT